MVRGYKIFDADAHAMLWPKMWEDLPASYAARRPRPVRIDDAADLGRWTNGWLIEGRLLPAPFGPGAQPGNEPKRVLKEFKEWFQTKVWRKRLLKNMLERRILRLLTQPTNTAWII